MSFFKPSSTFFSLNQYRKDKRDKIITLLQKLSNIITFNDENSHNFLADEMILFSRSLDFLKDKRLIDTANNVFNSNEIEYRDFSAIIWRKHILTWAGEHCKKIDGDFCDFGCYDGSGSQFINEYCELNKNNKIFYLYDTFTAPPNSHPFPKHSDSLYDDVVKKFRKDKNIRIIKGKLPKSMEGNLPNKIACFDFIKQIMPILRNKGYDINFKIIGRTSQSLKSKLEKFENVKVFTDVAYPEKLCKKAVCGISNLNIASGVQNKIYEYMNIGLPTIISQKCFKSLSA